MKMSKVAKMIGVDRRTVYNWVMHESLTHLFSPGALNEGDRDLSENDIFVVNTVNYLRQNITTDWDEIARQIEDGYRITDLSISATEVDTGKTPLQQFTRTLAIAQERDLALKQLEEIKKELNETQANYELKLEELRQQYEDRLNSEQQRSHDEIKRLMREASEREGKLQRELGKLEAMLEIFKHDKNDD